MKNRFEKASIYCHEQKAFTSILARYVWANKHLFIRRNICFYSWYTCKNN